LVKRNSFLVCFLPKILLFFTGKVTSNKFSTQKKREGIKKKIEENLLFLSFWLDCFNQPIKSFYQLFVLGRDSAVL